MKPSAASGPICILIATQVARLSTSAWLNAGVSGSATVRPSIAQPCSTSSNATPIASAAVRRV